MFVRTLVAVAALVCSTPGTTSDLPRQPTGKWIVHFDDAQCFAERNYGTEEDPLHFVLKQPPLGSVMQLSIMEKGSAGSATELVGTIGFDDQPPRKVRILRFAPKKMKLRVSMINLPLDQFAPVRSASSLRIRTTGLNQRFALAQLGPLLDVMNTCVADLRKVWNVGETADSESAVREDVKGELRGLFSWRDYPEQASLSGDTGTVETALLVDESGKVADCSVINTSGVAALDAQSCAVLKERAKFKPAVGKDGKPAKDAFRQQITWRLR